MDDAIVFQPPVPYLNVGWSSGLFGCCGENGNPGVFCLACCCGGVAQGILLKDLGLVSSCVGPVILYTAVDLVFARSFMTMILASLRMSMSDKLKRKENPCCSIMAACCCYPCAIAQLDRDASAPGRKYGFEQANGACAVATTYFGAIHGSAVPYHETAPLVPNGV